MAASTSGVGPSMSASGAFGEKILAWPWGVGASVFFSGPVSSSFISTSEPAATGSFGGGVPGADTVSGAVAGMGSERKMFSGLYQQSPQTPVLPWMQLGQIHALQFEHLFVVRFMQLSLLHFCPCSGGPESSFSSPYRMAMSGVSGGAVTSGPLLLPAPGKCLPSRGVSSTIPEDAGVSVTLPAVTGASR